MKQNYPPDIIASLFHEYFPEKEIISFSLCDGGAENSNFLIETANGKYILKIFENSKNEFEIVQSEVAIMTFVREKGVCVPRVFVVQATGERIVLGPENKPVILLEYIVGEQYRDTIPPDMCFVNLGAETARLHNALKTISGKYFIEETHKFDFKYLLRESWLRNVGEDLLDRDFLNRIWEDIDTVADTFLSLDQQIIHDDINRGNVIFGANNAPCVIDFSDIVVSARIQDIAITLVQFCCTAFWYPDGVNHYLRGYESVNVLSLDEKECLFACLELRLLNILLIPYLDTGLGDGDSFREQTLRYQKYLYRLHEFGKENFMKLIP